MFHPFLLLSSCGFTVVPLAICKTADEVVAYRAGVMEKRKSLDYDIDGLVVKERTIRRNDTARALYIAKEAAAGRAKIAGSNVYTVQPIR